MPPPIRVQTRIPRLLKDMNRPSVLVLLDDPEFLSRFSELWEEHIEGFSGLSRRTASKAKNESMEWKLRLKAKREAALVVQAKRHKRSHEAAPPVLGMRKSGQVVTDAERALAIERYRVMKEGKRKQPADAASSSPSRVQW
jgi:hypothetical protein